MTALVLIGLMMACAKLWFEVGALRSRIQALEHGASPLFHDEPAVPKPIARVVNAVSPTAPMLEPEVAQTPLPAFEPVHIEQPETAAPFIETITPPPARNFGFEDLFGRKLPIWAGGVTLAVAGFLIVKYSIDAGLLRPVVRVIMGLLFGSALIAGAELALRAHARVRDPRVRQALAGAGIATLYASVLIAANLYHLVPPLAAFVGMALITTLAGGLSLRFGAPCAVLGLLGGLAAPMLVGSGPPDVPLLSAYLALTIGGLCALSRKQRWMWLGALALIGGFGWGALLILGGALDVADALSVGIFTLILGIALPLFAFAGQRAIAVRLAGSLLGCAQLAALVATGGFAPLHWGLYGLISVAAVWLSRREPGLAQVPPAALAIAFALVTIWPHPSAAMLAAVLAGAAAIFGLPVIQRMWRDATPSGAIQLGAIATSFAAFAALHLDVTDTVLALLALLGSSLAGGVAAAGWRSPTRSLGARFAILVTTASALLVTAAMLVAPEWLAPPAVALVAAGLLVLAGRADDQMIERIAGAFGGIALVVTVLAPAPQLSQATGAAAGEPSLTAMARWVIPAAVAMLFAWRSRLPLADRVAQPIAVVLAYAAVAQIVPMRGLPLIPAAMLAALAFARRAAPALAAAAALCALWGAAPLSSWLVAGIAAMVGMPMLVTGLPQLDDVLLRLLIPAAAAMLVGWRHEGARARRVAQIGGIVFATIAVHIGYKHIFAIADAEAFVRWGMAERTVWEMLLAALAAALWRRMPLAGAALAGASLAHFTGFSLVLHNPLWAEQAVGGMPLANLLLPAFGTAFAITIAFRRIALPPAAMRARAMMQMALVILFAAASLRQLFHGSLLAQGDVGQAEDIARSALLIVIAIGFLRHGIVAAARDWRIASLVVMLVAVAKVFLIDAAGLDGLLRIASFAALGFSLMGIGWLYARYLPADRALTGDSALPDNVTQA